MITIIDYGAGNLFSVQNALNFLGVENNISSKVEDIISADKLILPGVGAFPDAMKMLDEAGLTEVIKEQAKKKALMGICLGMQMLFDKSYEFGETEGLGPVSYTHLDVYKRQEESHKRKYENDWVVDILPANDEYELGYDYHECGICKLCKDEGCPELAQYLCRMDYVLADIMDMKLTRTKTIAEGADMCDFRYSRK